MDENKWIERIKQLRFSKLVIYSDNSVCVDGKLLSQKVGEVALARFGLSKLRPLIPLDGQTYFMYSKKGRGVMITVFHSSEKTERFLKKVRDAKKIKPIGKCKSKINLEKFADITPNYAVSNSLNDQE